MTQQELYKAVHENLKYKIRITNDDLALIVQTVVQTIIQQLVSGNSVKLRWLGTLEVTPCSTASAHVDAKPQPEVQSRRVVKFRVSRSLIKQLNKDTDEKAGV